MFLDKTVYTLASTLVRLRPCSVLAHPLEAVTYPIGLYMESVVGVLSSSMHQELALPLSRAYAAEGCFRSLDPRIEPRVPEHVSGLCDEGCDWLLWHFATGLLY